jgi:DNA-binding response OmpR family regulator
MRVMIIEDEKEVRDVLIEALSESFELDILADGENLSQHLKDKKPDLLLLDQKLPGKSGADCIREVRGNPGFAKTRWPLLN